MSVPTYVELVRRAGIDRLHLQAKDLPKEFFQELDCVERELGRFTSLLNDPEKCAHIPREIVENTIPALKRSVKSFLFEVEETLSNVLSAENFAPLSMAVGLATKESSSSKRYDGTGAGKRSIVICRSSTERLLMYT